MGNEPTMVDLGREFADDDATSELLSAIGRQMERDAEHRQNFLDRIHNEAKAEALALRHGVMHALETVTYGGTTAQYEDCLQEIQLALDVSRFDGPVKRWYIEQEENATGINRERHPSYQRAGGVA